jgi:hypothetical protein
MGHRNLISGLGHINMWEIGKIIKRMGLEFNIIQMVISMKEDGVKIKDTVKEHIGSLMLKIN